MCVFCDIIDGKIPSKKVYEDNELLAILDISQATKGHTLVIPKKHFENMLETDDEYLSKLIIKSKELAKRITKSLNAQGFNLLINTSKQAGQTVMHTHIHILPRYETGDNLEISFKENKYDMDEILKQINGH